MSSLPGFYYDEEKRRYYKIQKRHQAPKGSKSTGAAIKAHKEKNLESERLAQHQQMMAQSRIQRSRMLQHPLEGVVGLQRELGSIRSSDIAANQAAWATGLRKRLYTSDDWSDPRGPQTNISHFVQDEPTQIVVYSSEGLTAIRANSDDNEDTNSSAMVVHFFSTSPHHDMTSLTLSPSRVLM